MGTRRALSIHAAASAVIVVTTLAATSCAVANGDISGGDPRFDAAAPLSTLNIDGGPLGTGHTWQELYADYFGNPRSACAGNGSCHGGADQPGAQQSSFVCPPGDKDSCHDSLVSSAAGLVVPNDPADSALLTQVLRHADGSSGNMPKSPPYAFTSTDLQRISDWISAGALNDSDVPGADSGTDLDSGIEDSPSD